MQSEKEVEIDWLLMYQILEFAISEKEESSGYVPPFGGGQDVLESDDVGFHPFCVKLNNISEKMGMVRFK